MARNLTEYERLAVRQWAAREGRSWRKALWHAWQTGNYGWSDLEKVAVLQSLRNELGPSWLYKFNLSKGE